MTGATGLEPATSAVTGQRSNLLSYAPVEHGFHGWTSAPTKYAKARRAAPARRLARGLARGQRDGRCEGNWPSGQWLH